MSDPHATPASVLLLCDDDPSHAGNVIDHIGALTGHSRHHVVRVNPRVGDRGAQLDLEDFDAIVIHYTIVVTLDAYLPFELAERISRFGGLKVQFIQDEYRWVDEVTARMRTLGIDVLFTCVPEAVAPLIYGERLPGVQTITTLAGYVPDQLVGRAVPPLDARPIDVGYRGRAVPYWLGRLGQDKLEIARGFLEHAAGSELRCDIAWTESDRIYGERWFRFLASCRATLGTESGASVIDFDGSLERRAHDYLTEHPAAAFDEVERAILAEYEGRAAIQVISPRIFEAAALRTALILFPGHYSNAVEPWTHYIPLDRDFANFADVSDRLRDSAFLEELTSRAYVDLVESGAYSLERFVREFDDVVDERVSTRQAGPQRPAYPMSRRPRQRKPGALRRGVRKTASFAGSGRALAAAPEARRLLVEHARSADARRLVSFDRLLEDVEKLAVLIANQRTRVAMSIPFAIVPMLEGKRLILASKPLEALEPVADATARSHALSALRAGMVNEIVWNHARIGQVAWLQLTPFRAVPIDVGYYGMYGAHHFSALERLRPLFGDMVVAALAGVLSPPDVDKMASHPRLNAVMRTLAYGSAALRIARLAMPIVKRDPKSFALRGLYAGLFALRNRPVRALVRSYAAEPAIRAHVDPLELLDDILKLQLVRKAGTGPETHLRATLDASTGTLVVTTEQGFPGERIPAPNGTVVQHLLWDNSACGSTVRLKGGVSATLDEDARHHFRALSEIARSDAGRMQAVLDVVLGEGIDAPP